jgi:hypothetical protein
LISEKIDEPAKCYQHDAGSNHTDERTVHMAKADLSAARLRELFHYNPENGEFLRNGRRVGFLVPPKNYRRVLVDGRQWLEHRLAWLYMNGSWPCGQIDHINGVKTDNRIANLRDVTAATNMENMRRPMSHNKSSGILGVTWAKNEKKWKAQISVGGTTRHLGYSDTPEDAREIYLAAKRRLHEGCTI